MKRRGSGKKSKAPQRTAVQAPRVETAKRTKAVKKQRTGPYVPSLVHRCLEFIGTNTGTVFPTPDRLHDGLQKVIRDVLTWEPSKRDSVPRLPALIEAMFPHITKLDLADTFVNFTTLTRCHDLETLNLRNTSIGDKDLEGLLLANANLQVSSRVGLPDIGRSSTSVLAAT
jgi:hypothetical protein